MKNDRGRGTRDKEIELKVGRWKDEGGGTMER